MKKRILFFVFFLCVSFLLKAQFKLGPSIGLQVPISSYFSDYASAGFGFGGTGKYMITDKMAIGGNVFYTSFGSRYGGYYNWNYRYSIIPVTGMFQYYFTNNDMRFYAGGDMGLYFFWWRWKYYYNNTQIIGYDSDTSVEFGMAPTFGMEYEINNRIILDGNTKLHFMLTTGNSFVYLGVLNVGILFVL